MPIQASGMVFVVITAWTVASSSSVIKGVNAMSSVPVKLKNAVSTDRILSGIPLKSECKGIIRSQRSNLCINIT